MTCICTGYMLRVLQSRCWSGCVPFCSAEPESSLKIIQFVGRIHFLAAVELRPSAPKSHMQFSAMWPFS